MKKYTGLFIFLLFFSQSFSQKKDSLRAHKVYVQNILPATLIISGSIISGSKFEKKLQTNLRDKVGNNFEFKIDNYIQYAPIAELYIADIAGVKAKNHWFDQTKYLLISNIISSLITHGLKNITRKTRPNGADYSFPSGHTSFSFTNASVLHQEFKTSAPVFAYSGYLFSTTTGIFRMLNNKHWLSDVLVSAGIGILVTNMVYYFKPFKNFNPFKKNKRLSFYPLIENKVYRLKISYHF